MRNKRLQGQITTGRWTLPAVVCIVTFCWALISFILPHLAQKSGDSTFFWLEAQTRLLPYWADRGISYATYALIGYLLIELNNQFAIIRMRASVQTAIYFLLVTICPEMQLLYAGDVAAVALLISIFFLFKSYQQIRSASYLFYSFLFIGAGSILFPQLSFLLPLWLLGTYRFQSLTLRSFCGAALGWITPYWLLFGYAVLQNQMTLFYRPFAELISFKSAFNWSVMNPWELATLGYLFVLFAVSATHCFSSSYEDKIRTRSYLQFLSDLTFVIFLLIAWQPLHYNDYLSLLLLGNSILIGHFFTLTHSKASNLFFIATLVGFILLYSFNIWMLL